MGFTSSRVLSTGAAVLAAAALALGGAFPASAATDAPASDPRGPMSPEAREAALIVADYVTRHPQPAMVSPDAPMDVWNEWATAEYAFLNGFPFSAGYRQYECTEKYPTTVHLKLWTDTSRGTVGVASTPICTQGLPSMALVLKPRLASDVAPARD